MKFLKRKTRVALARLALSLMLFGGLGVVAPMVFGSSITAEASSTPKPSEEPKSYEEQLNEAQKEYDDKNIKNLSKDIEPGANDLTNMLSSPFIYVLNAIMYVALSLINAYFFVQTCFDIAFLTAPGFRETLSGNQDNEGGSGKVARAVNGLISEAALNAVGYNKSADNKRHIECNEMAKEVDWKGWLIRRLVMFISMMAYLALLMMGLVSSFVSLFTKIGYAIVQAVMKLLGGS